MADKSVAQKQLKKQPTNAKKKEKVKKPEDFLAPKWDPYYIPFVEKADWLKEAHKSAVNVIVQE